MQPQSTRPDLGIEKSIVGGPGVDTGRRLRCPENENAFKQNIRDHNHNVSTNLSVDVRSGSAVIVGRAECRCGWSDEVVLGE